VKSLDRRWVSTVRITAAVAIACSLAGCTASAPSAAPSATSAAPSDESAPPPAATTDVLAPTVPGAHTLIGALSSQRGNALVGPYRRSSDEISVSVQCVGTGTVAVEVVGVGSFPHRCGHPSQDIGVQNSFDVRFVDTIEVRVSGDNSLVWALAVAAPS
jgi:hypothetical protein